MSGTLKDMQSREIITKAVIGRGRKFSQATHTITPSNTPSTILGAWIINHTYSAEKTGESVEVVGSYDVNIWYSYDNNTKTEVSKETVSYVEQVPLSYYDGHVRGSVEVMAHETQQPNCIEAKVGGSLDSIMVRVEREFAVEVVGETKMCVLVTDNCDDLEDKDVHFDDEFDEMDDFDDLDPEVMIDDLD
ncbi:MAG: outer spore coat protein CotE [Bacillaceae bacterium]|nr:outer spore coat protein CotE [Bacillaceae bacterium]